MYKMKQSKQRYQHPITRGGITLLMVHKAAGQRGVRVVRVHHGLGRQEARGRLHARLEGSRVRHVRFGRLVRREPLLNLLAVVLRLLGEEPALAAL